MTNYAGPGPVDTQQALAGHHLSHEVGGADEVRPWQIGDVVMAYGLLATLLGARPGWKLMDGTVTLPDGTTPPDMRDKVPVGAGNLYAMGTTGGALSNSLTHDHNHDAAADALTFGNSIANATPAGAFSIGTSGHTHTAHAAHSASTLQPYAALYFLIYVGGQ